MRRLATHLVSAFRTPARGWASFAVCLSDGRRFGFIRSDGGSVVMCRCETRVMVMKVVTARLFLPGRVFTVATDLVFTLTNMATPETGKAGLSDSSDAEDLFASPSRTSKQTKPSYDRPLDSANNLLARSGNGVSRYDTEQIRNAQLQKELEGVRGINEVIDGVVSSLECAKDNMEVRLPLMAPILRQAYSNNVQTVSRTVTSASTLLNTWIRILSQTEHNQRLLLNTNWHGAVQDLANIENEAILRMQAAERKAAEEVRRKEEARRRAEEEERQQQAGATRGARGTRGRGRGVGRACSVSSSGYGVGGSSNLSSSRGTSQTTAGRSGIGRSSGSVRGRGRGVR